MTKNVSAQKDAFRELKAYGSPPAYVVNVSYVIGVILGEPSKEWKDMQKLLANPVKFIDRLVNFDRYSLSNA